MPIRNLLLMALASFALVACSTTDEADMASDVEVQQREDIAGGPLDGTEVFDDSFSQGPAPGSQQDLVVNVGDRVFYGFDRFDLSPEARRTLELQAEWLKRYPDVRVVIKGHTDERGTREYNLALGDRRANSVKNYLVALGISPSRINTVSFGKEQPAVLGSNESAWAQNRRAVTEVE